MKSIISLLLLTLLNAINARTKVSSPFLSSTLSTKITFLSTADDSGFDSDRKAIFSEALTHFLRKIFHDQQVYDVKIISVNIFDDHVLHDGHHEEPHRHNSRENESAQHSLSFSTVIAAEYTEEDAIGSIADDSFREMLVHVCEKFHAHLIRFLQDTDDPYFMEVESVVLGDFENRVYGIVKGGGNTMSSSEATNNHNGAGNTSSIIAIVLGSIAFVSLAFAATKFYRIEKELREKRWRTKEIATLSSANSPGALQHTTHPVDDYSFNPSPGVDNEYRAITSASKEITTISSTISPGFSQHTTHPVDDYLFNPSLGVDNGYKAIMSGSREIAALSSTNSPGALQHTSQPVDDYSFNLSLKAIMSGSKEIARLSLTKSPGALQHTTHPVDDYSFNLSPGVENEYRGIASAYTDYRDDPIIENWRIDEEEICLSSVSPELAPPNNPPKHALFPDPHPVATTKVETSYVEELNRLQKQHVFAPPGKIGVAIDAFNGLPVVHKVRRNSPLENMLQPKDVIVAVDDEDVSCSSTADITSMMVKRMDRVRKITFVRRG